MTTMPEPYDLEINRAIRKILVRHWIDLGRLFFRSLNGVITIRGELERIAGTSELLTPPLVETIFSELRRISGVKRVTIDLSNWMERDGIWIQREKEEGEKKEATGKGGTFHIETE